MQHHQPAGRRRRPDARCPAGVDLVHGRGPAARARRPRPAAHPGAGRRHRRPRRRHGRRQRRRPHHRRPASWCCCSARSAPGKSSLLSALAGLVTSTGEIRWNGEPRRTTRRPSCAPAGSPTSPRCRGCFSGTFADNVRLDHADRAVRPGAGDRPAGRRRRGGRRPGRAGRPPRRPAVRRPGAAARAGPGPGLRRRAAAGRRRLLGARRRDRDRAVDGAARSAAPRSSARPPSARRWPRPTGSWCSSRAGSPRSGRGRSWRRAGVTWPAEPDPETGPRGDGPEPGPRTGPARPVAPPPPATCPRRGPARRSASTARPAAAGAVRRDPRRPPGRPGR